MPCLLGISLCLLPSNAQNESLTTCKTLKFGGAGFSLQAPASHSTPHFDERLKIGTSESHNVKPSTYVFILNCPSGFKKNLIQLEKDWKLGGRKLMCSQALGGRARPCSRLSRDFFRTFAFRQARVCERKKTPWPLLNKSA